jgi:WD40 repeat protein
MERAATHRARGLEHDGKRHGVELGDGRVLAPLAGHTDAVTSVAFDPSGRVVATASDDGTARLWNSTAGDELVPVDRRPAPTAAAFAGGTTILTTAQRTARLVTVEGTLRRQIRTRAEIRGTAVSRSSFALLEADGTVEVVAGDTRLLPARGVSAVAYLPDGRLVLGFRDGSLRIGRRTARDGGSAVAAIAARAGRVAVLGADGRVRVYSDDGELLSRPRTSAGAVALSPDGETLATAAGRDATLWNAGTGAREHTLRGHRSLVTDVEFSPDGRLLVTASADHDARLWDVASGRLRHVLRGHFFAVRSASFSPDGRWVVTASQFTAGLWDVASGRLVSYLRGHVKPLTTASFGPGGWIATASEDGTARAVRCDICRSLPGLEEVARARLAAVRR